MCYDINAFSQSHGMTLFTQNMMSFYSYLFQIINSEKVTKSKITIHYLGRFFLNERSRHVFNMYFTNLMDV